MEVFDSSRVNSKLIAVEGDRVPVLVGSLVVDRGCFVSRGERIFGFPVQYKLLSVGISSVT